MQADIQDFTMWDAFQMSRAASSMRGVDRPSVAGYLQRLLVSIRRDAAKGVSMQAYRLPAYLARWRYVVLQELRRRSFQVTATEIPLRTGGYRLDVCWEPLAMAS